MPFPATSKALKLAQKFGLRREEGQAHFETTLALDKLGDHAGALSKAGKALMILEDIEACGAVMIQETLITGSRC
jgi:hypothetical protein